MASNGKKENILTSWKEIAAYLDRDVRTCLRWEQRYGLPVHRLERDSKAKVFAYKDQIDAWLAARSEGAAARPEERSASLVRRFLRPWPLLAALAAVAVGAYFAFFRPAPADPGPAAALTTPPAPAPPGPPADFHLRGSAFIVVDASDRELWQFDTRLTDLQDEDYYRDHFPEKGRGADYIALWPYVMIRDLDGDDRPEVLFSAQTRSEDLEATLFCFDDRGTKRWSFTTGRALDFGGVPFRDEYRIHGFNVGDYDGDGAPEILVISIHKPQWPCQAVLLDASGKAEGEYWNAGYFFDADAGDVDGDGNIELVLSGVNNEYRRGAVAIFDAGRLGGHSPQVSREFIPGGIGAGTQSAYILFPKSDVQSAIRLPGDPVNNFWIHPGDGLTAVTTEAQIHYDLDRRLAVRSVTLSNYFLDLHDKFTREGKVRSVLDDRYKEALRDAVMIFREGRWAGGPGVDPAELARMNRGLKPE